MALASGRIHQFRFEQPKFRGAIDRTPGQGVGAPSDWIVRMRRPLMVGPVPAIQDCRRDKIQIAKAIGPIRSARASSEGVHPTGFENVNGCLQSFDLELFGARQLVFIPHMVVDLCHDPIILITFGNR